MVGAEFLDDSVLGEGCDVGGGEVEDDFALAGPVGGGAVVAAESAGDEGGDAAAGDFAWGEAGAGGCAGADAVDAERTPVLAVQVPGHEVPAVEAGDQVVGFYAAGSFG